MIFIGWFITKNIENKFYKILDKNNLNNNVRYLGYLTGENKEKIFHESDIFIYPSYKEGCPTAVIEALASGCFVISTDVAALKEVINDGENGFIVRKNNSKDIMKKIEYVLKNYDIIFEKSKSIKEEALKRYESRIIIDHIHGTYLELLRGDLDKQKKKDHYNNPV